MYKFFVTGDIHHDIDRNKLSKKNFARRVKPDKSDYMFIAGDYGAAWYGDKRDDENLIWHGTKPFQIVFAEGNHEHHDYLDSLPLYDWCGGKVHLLYPTQMTKEQAKLYTPSIHLLRGYVYTIAGKKFFAFGGGDSIDKLQRVEGVSWWKREMPSYQEYNRGIENLEKHNWDVDYVLTHVAPERFLSQILFGSYEVDQLNKYLDMLYQKLYFKKWFCGHYHREIIVDKSSELFQFYALYHRIYEFTDNKLIHKNRW